MLTVRELRKAFGPIRAVEGVSFEVAPGEILGLLGPNGAGKSTTIGMIVGLVTPDSGSVDVGGKGSCQSVEARRLVGVCPQQLALYEDLSAMENLAFFASVYGLTGDRFRERAHRVLDEVGLADRAGDRARTFSGGMKRRLNLAVALMHEPPVVLLDEPTAGVDPQSRNNILELVRALKARGVAVIYTTHYMEEAQKICDRVAIIDKGVVLAIDAVDALIAAHGGRSVVTVATAGGESRIDTSDPLREVQAAAGRADVLNIRIDRPDLESVFLALTGRSLRD
jgi:ABC-2 type transport system ATP-binding protein